MKIELSDYIQGNKNVVRDEFIISREVSGNAEIIFVEHPDVANPIYQFWRAKNKKPGKKTDAAPKHTGGKKPYVMLMVEELVKLMTEGMPAEYAGYVLYLAPYVEWGTGKLIRGRKKETMCFKDVMEVLGKSYKTSQSIIAGLKKHGLLEHRKDGYYVSRNLIKKGKAKHENQV